VRATPFGVGQMAIVGRRNFIAALGGIAFAWSLAARAQQADRMRRVGVLLNRAADDPEEQARVAAFLQRLQDLGWTDGRNVRVNYRWAAAEADRSCTYAAALVALAPDVILAAGSQSVAALQQTATTQDSRRCGYRHIAQVILHSCQDRLPFEPVTFAIAMNRIRSYLICHVCPALTVVQANPQSAICGVSLRRTLR
jgi:hypothetical protein